MSGRYVVRIVATQWPDFLRDGEFVRSGGGESTPDLQKAVLVGKAGYRWRAAAFRLEPVHVVLTAGELA